MDRNALLAFLLSFLVLTAWMMWEARHAPQPGPRARQQAARTSEQTRAGAPAPQGAHPLKSPPAQPKPPPAPHRPEQRVALRTPFFEAQFSSVGGSLVRWRLLRYRATPAPDAPPVALVRADEEGTRRVLTLVGEIGGLSLSDLHFGVLEADSRSVRFATRVAGVEIEKRFAFDADGYRGRVSVEIRNHGEAGIRVPVLLRIPVLARPGSDFADAALSIYHAGGREKLMLRSFGRRGLLGGLRGTPPERERWIRGDVDWAGVQTRYFLLALLPEAPRDAVARAVARVPGKEAEVDVGYPPVELRPGQSLDREFRIYLGPKEPERLAAVGSQLDQSIDWGWSWVAPLTRAFTWLLRAMHEVVPNYGIAIILLTVAVRVVTAPLATRQMRSMRKMGELQPRVKEIQERYRDDRQRQQQEMMKLWREAGVNPLGGCLPMLLQVPVFFGLYYALRTSIDLRHAPFVGWIQDLASPEAIGVLPGLGLPVRVLPLLMGASMVVQQRLTPSSVDPAQARMMMTVMPVMFTVLFYQFPSGLVLYWLVSNVLAIGQQLWINRRLALEEGRKR